MNSCSTMLNCGLFSCFIVNEDQDTKGTKYIQKPLSVSSIFSNIKLNELYRWICWRMIWLIEKIIHDQSGLTHEEYSMKNKIQHELPTVQLQTRFPSWCTIILEVILACSDALPCHESFVWLHNCLNDQFHAVREIQYATGQQHSDWAGCWLYPILP